MAIRLTILLCGVLFIAMLSVGEVPELAERPESAEAVAEQPRGERAAVEPPAEPGASAADLPAVTAKAPPIAPPPEPVAAAVDAAVQTAVQTLVTEAPEADSTPETDPEPALPALLPRPDPETADADPAEAVTLSRLTLNALRLQDDEQTAMSLADRVRARSAEEAAATPIAARPRIGADPDTPPPAAAPPPAPRIAMITGDRVNLRAGPSTADPVRGQVVAGQSVRVLGDAQGEWIRIDDPAGGEPVFVASRFLQMLDN